jgi:hypothetical protein
MKEDERSEARVGHMRNAYKILNGKHEGKKHLEGLGIERIILKYDLKQKCVGRVQRGLRRGAVGSKS